MEQSKRTRREFLRLAGLSAAGAIVAACAGEPEVVEKIVMETVVVEKVVEKEVTVLVQAAETAEPTATPVPEAKFQESPMLAERVAKGELPPVEERLPEDIRVCPLTDSIGRYGGTMIVGDLTMNLFAGDAQRMSDYPNLLRISQDGTHALPHILKDWKLSDDATSVTCYMRKGMRWSDGEPLTTADIQFYYEDVLKNVEITPVTPKWFRPGGELMKLDILDDYTYKLTFAQPHPRFVMVCMAHREGWGDNNTFVPSHYVKQFHIKYNDKADELAKEAGFDFWYQNFLKENNRMQTIERPRLEAFIPVRDTPQMSFLERNPFYSAVDPEGNQLPYIDKVNMDRCADVSVLDAKVTGGNYDYAAFWLRVLFWSTYAEGAARSNARMIRWESGKGSDVVYNTNMNWPESEKREVFTDDRFRQALSLAINRADINNVIYFGNASETQMTVVPASRHYKPEYASAYAEYDVGKANALLDDLGLAWNAAHTHRTWPISKTDVVIAWDLVEQEGPKGPVAELVTEYWKAIGIEIQWKSITRNLLTQKIGANEEPMSCWHGDETMDTLFLFRPKFFAPISGDESTWGQLWGLWYNTEGEQGEEPPQIIKDLYNWLDEYNLTDANEPAAKVLQSQAEHIWTIGTVGNAPVPVFMRNTVKNVSENCYYVWDLLTTFPLFVEQWYLEQA